MTRILILIAVLIAAVLAAFDIDPFDHPRYIGGPDGPVSPDGPVNPGADGRYRLDFDGAEMCFDGYEESYAPGDPVVFYFCVIATDTDYHFYVDGNHFSPDYTDRGFEFRFDMPDHDVLVTYDEINTMYGDWDEYYRELFTDEYGTVAEVTNYEGFYGEPYAIQMTGLFSVFNLVGLPLQDLDLAPQVIPSDNQPILLPLFQIWWGRGYLVTDPTTGIITGASIYMPTEASDAICEALLNLAGTIDDSGAEPYAETNGGEVIWYDYTVGNCQVHVKIPSELDEMQLEFTVK